MSLCGLEESVLIFMAQKPASRCKGENSVRFLFEWTTVDAFAEVWLVSNFNIQLNVY